MPTRLSQRTIYNPLLTTAHPAPELTPLPVPLRDIGTRYVLDNSHPYTAPTYPTKSRFTPYTRKVVEGKVTFDQIIQAHAARGYLPVHAPGSPILDTIIRTVTVNLRPRFYFGYESSPDERRNYDRQGFLLYPLYVNWYDFTAPGMANAPFSQSARNVGRYDVEITWSKSRSQRWDVSSPSNDFYLYRQDSKGLNYQWDYVPQGQAWATLRQNKQWMFKSQNPTSWLAETPNYTGGNSDRRSVYIFYRPDTKQNILWLWKSLGISGSSRKTKTVGDPIAGPYIEYDISKRPDYNEQFTADSFDFVNDHIDTPLYNDPVVDMRLIEDVQHDENLLGYSRLKRLHEFGVKWLDPAALQT